MRNAFVHGNQNVKIARSSAKSFAILQAFQPGVFNRVNLMDGKVRNQIMSDTFIKQQFHIPSAAGFPTG